MIDTTSWLHVSKNDPIAGGMAAAISAIRSSGMGPGPLGISETRPMAEATCSIAIHASSTLAMQQILTRGLVVAFIDDQKRLESSVSTRYESSEKKATRLVSKPHLREEAPRG